VQFLLLELLRFFNKFIFSVSLWIMNGESISFVNAAFRHVEKVVLPIMRDGS